MQKLINVLACVSFGVSAGIVAGGTYVYLQKDAIVDNIKQQVTEAATDGVKELLGQSQLGSALIGGVDDVDVTDEALGPAVPMPVVPF